SAMTGRAFVGTSDADARGHGGGEPLDALLDLRRRHEAVREARRAPAAVTAGEEVRSLDERDPGGRGPLEQVGCIDVVGEVEPDEVPAAGPAPTLATVCCKVPFERREHGVATGAQEPSDALQVRLEAAAAEELEDRRLGEEGRRDVRRDGHGLELVRE